MQREELVCLANSTKLGGHCVAGVRTRSVEWVRPVGPRPGGTLWSDECRPENAPELELLDVFTVELGAPCPSPYQPENWAITRVPWRVVAHLSADVAADLLQPLVLPGPDLFGNTSNSVSAALLDARPADRSLALVEPREAVWHIAQGRHGRQPRVRFRLEGAFYDLPLTDPKMKHQLADLEVYGSRSARVPAGQRLLFTVSLAEPYEGFCYKLVAAVFLLPL